MFIVQPTTSTNDISRRRSSVRAMKLKRCNKYIIFLTSIKMRSKSCRNHLWTYYIVLYETFWNFINTVTRDGYCDYVEKVWNKSENLHKSYEIFSVGTYFVKITKIFKQSIILMNLDIQWGHFLHSLHVWDVHAPYWPSTKYIFAITDL